MSSPLETVREWIEDHSKCQGPGDPPDQWYCCWCAWSEEDHRLPWPAHGNPDCKAKRALAALEEVEAADEKRTASIRLLTKGVATLTTERDALRALPTKEE